MISSIIPLDQGQKSLILLRNGDFTIRNMAPKILMDCYFKDHGVSYEGGRKVSCELLGVRQKAPVSLSYYQEIVFFPTHSLTNCKCSFINAANVKKVTPLRNCETKVEFIHNYVIFPIGVRSVKKQMKRCDFLINRKIDYGKYKIN